VSIFLDEHGNEQIVNFVYLAVFLRSYRNFEYSFSKFQEENNNNPLYHLKILIKTENGFLSLRKTKNYYF
jgi:hypothetical protein